MSTFVKQGSRIIYTDEHGRTHSLRPDLNLIPSPNIDYRFFITAKTLIAENDEDLDLDLVVSAKSVTIPAPPGAEWTRDALIEELSASFFFRVILSEDVVFDNTDTKLNSTDVENAIKEIDRRTIDMAEPSGFLRNTPITNGVIELSPDGTTIYSVNYDGIFSENASGNFANGTVHETPALARQFAMFPALGEGDYQIYIQGLNYRIATIQVVTLDNTTGIKYIHHAENGTLVAADTLAPDYFNRSPITSVVYGNATHQELIVFGDERHGIEMPGATHKYLHFTDGTRYVSGMAIQGLAAGVGVFSAITAGVAYDEDIIMNFIEQANVQKWFIDASGWRTVLDTNILGYIDGVDTYVSYNEETSPGVFQLTEITGNDYMAVHFLATNNVVSPFVQILGQRLYATAGTARTGIFEEVNALHLKGLPTPEFLFIGSAIISKTGILVLQNDGSLYLDLRRPPRTIYDVQ